MRKSLLVVLLLTPAVLYAQSVHVLPHGSITAESWCDANSLASPCLFQFDTTNNQVLVNGGAPAYQLNSALTVQVGGAGATDTPSANRRAFLAGGTYTAHPFATISAALASIPKNLNGYVATVRLNTGTYGSESSALITGYTGGGKVRVTGASLGLAIESIAGTPTSGTGSSGTTATSLYLSTADWPYSLRSGSDNGDNYLVITGGPGSSGDPDNPVMRPIKSNTSTTIIVDAIPGMSAGTQFAIEQATSVLTIMSSPPVTGASMALAVIDNDSPIELIAVAIDNSSNFTQAIYVDRTNKFTAWGLTLDNDSTSLQAFEAAESGTVSVYDSLLRSTSGYPIFLQMDTGTRVQNVQRVVESNGTVYLSNGINSNVIVDSDSATGNAVKLTNFLSSTAAVNAPGGTATPVHLEGITNFQASALTGSGPSPYGVEMSHGGTYYLGSATMAGSGPQALSVDGYPIDYGTLTSNGAVDGVGSRVVSSTGRMMELAKFQIVVGSSPGDELISNDITAGGQTKNYGLDYALGAAYGEVNAYATGGQSNATPIAYRRTTVVYSTSGGTDSIILPGVIIAGGAGGEIQNASSYTIALFPSSGTKLCNPSCGTTNSSLSVTSGQWVKWQSMNSGNWQVKIW